MMIDVPRREKAEATRSVVSSEAICEGVNSDCTMMENSVGYA